MSNSGQWLVDAFKALGSTGATLTYLTVAATAIAAAWNYIGPKIWERYAARAKARDEFIKGTTAGVVKLARTHYWALANAAGTAADLLAEHLRSLQLHLMVSYAGRNRIGEDAVAELRANIDRVCKSNAEFSFPSIVRLIVLFDRFQFSGSETYLLPNHAAGMALRRLYNQFVGALPEGAFISDIRKAVEKHLKEEKKWESGAAPLGLGGSFLSDRTQLDDVLGLKETRERYQRWLRDSVVNVADAADALRAYAELLSHELAELNYVFFRDKGKPRTTGEFAVETIIGSSWSGVLNEDSILTLQRAAAESEFYRPLGGVSARWDTVARAREDPKNASAKGNAPPLVVAVKPNDGAGASGV